MTEEDKEENQDYHREWEAAKRKEIGEAKWKARNNAKAKKHRDKKKAATAQKAAKEKGESANTVEDEEVK